MNVDPLGDARAAAVVEEMKRSKLVVPPTLRESFTGRYIIALLLIALLSIGAGYSGVRLISAQSDAAAEVNVSGRQRMLSQRIALFSTVYLESSGSDRDAAAQTLRRAVDEMADAQAGLLNGDPALGIDGPPSDQIRSLFEAGVADDVDSYLALARSLLDASGTPDQDAATLGRIQATAADSLVGQLDAVVSAYQADSEQRIDDIAREEKVVLVATLVALALEAMFVFRPMSRRISTETARLEAAAARHQAEAARHAFGIQLRDAVELADSEDDLINTIATAHEVSRVPGEFEFLRTDPDEPSAMVGLDVDTPAPTHHCSVLTADGCPALRRGRSLTFSDPHALGACRHFRADALASTDPAVSTTCVPVTFRGAGIGVLRTVTPKETQIDNGEFEDLHTIALTAGTHIGTLRAFAATRADAEHDALTGLLNRRGIDEGVKRMMTAGVRYVVAVADLDDFKAVNDEHGHDAGDAALAETARIMGSVLRPDDLLGRHGGEEFVIVIPIGADRPTDGDLAAGVSVAERIRVALHTARATSRLPLCTVSIGVGSSDQGLQAAIQQADAALYRAKERGRNRVEVEGNLLQGLSDILSSDEPLTADGAPTRDA